MIYLLFGGEYASALGTSYELLIWVLMTVVLTNGVAELLLAVLIASAVCIPLVQMERSHNL